MAQAHKQQNVKGSVEQQFSQVAAHYAVSPVHSRGADLEKIIELGRFDGSEVVLDAGSGAGHTALRIAPHVAQVTAVDLSHAMLTQGSRLAEERGIGNIRFEPGDVEDLPFAPQSFDLVASRFSAHHWPNPLDALMDFRRVLGRTAAKPGRILLVDTVSFDDFSLDTHLQTIELLRDPSHVRDHTIAQWMEMFERAGFDAEVALTWSLFIDFESWVERMATPPENVTVLRKLLAAAPVEVRSALQVQPDDSFSLQCVLFDAQIAA